ncbi:von Willebrand factor type A domain-containing protein [Aureisphaera galaxeae]|uniref:YfbK domain-containing protein n=1 Tax=Aureisphaera galaxeae TaxID=1538023 RepID=UPI002350EB21|nr:von Willebrand factor type A domain-containing protein [Aureisphaera galaxeae]MDC8004875.1 von Willebrand factor type A domain-containing protein [Aureisphaera galaxeae]
MRTVILLWALILSSSLLQAQEVEIMGTITDEANLPMYGVSVVVKGTSRGTQTDSNGEYTIQANVGQTLVYGYVGYITEEMEVLKDTPEISFAMKLAPALLEEVVVKGFVVKKEKRALGYSVSSVQQEAIKESPRTDLSQYIRGKAAGVKITTQNGNPGTSNKVVIRGTNSFSGDNNALYIIDGVPVSSNVAKGKSVTGNLGTARSYDLDTKNIDRVDILKGAAATALYGSEGRNGVIVITTKDGKGVPVSNNESYKYIPENTFKNVATSPLSTFSIDVDKAGYSNIRRMINNGQEVPQEAVKIEEMINYFSYDYPNPEGEHPFSIQTEMANSPWNKDAKLVKIGLKGKDIAQEKVPPSNLVFLIDVSGSMNSNNKLGLLKSSFGVLVDKLREKDKVSIVVYAGAAGVVLEPTHGDDKDTIMDAINRLSAGGSTAGGQGIQLAYKMAQENFIKGGNNRVILATDGDFNVGASSDRAMEELIEEKRKGGVFLTVLGFGMGNYKDSKMETLANKGNGNHAYIDTMQEAQKVLGAEFFGTMYTIAKDVKIQVEFNPVLVQAHRLIGYENRLLEDRDFNDDTKDAGEIGSGHTVTALYEIIPVGVESIYVGKVDTLKYRTSNHTNTEDELLTVKFRYKEPDGDKSKLIVRTLTDTNSSFESASQDFKFSAAVALFGLQLRKSIFIDTFNKKDVIALAQAGKGLDEDGYKAEFIRLVRSY